MTRAYAVLAALVGLSLMSLTIVLVGIYNMADPHRAYDILKGAAVQIDEDCSGVVIDKKRGLVVTAHHCTAIFAKDYKHVIEYITYNDDGSELGRFSGLAVLVADDAEHDVSILKMLGRNLTPGEIALSSTTVRYGDTLYVLGNPHAYENFFTAGIVVTPYWDVGPAMRRKTPFFIIVSNVLIAPGSSGGPAVNQWGELIGLTNWEAFGKYAGITRAEWIAKALATVEV